MLRSTYAELPTLRELLTAQQSCRYKVKLLSKFSYIVSCCHSPVTPVVTSSSAMYTTNETTPVTFQCSSTGIPTPSISWYRNGTALTPRSDPRVTVGSPSQQLLSPVLYQVTQTLTITNTADTDSGNYSCVGSNTAGTDTALFTLVVQSK